MSWWFHSFYQNKTNVIKFVKTAIALKCCTLNQIFTLLLQAKSWSGYCSSLYLWSEYRQHGCVIRAGYTVVTQPCFQFGGMAICGIREKSPNGLTSILLMDHQDKETPVKVLIGHLEMPTTLWHLLVYFSSTRVSYFSELEKIYFKNRDVSCVLCYGPSQIWCT